MIRRTSIAAALLALLTASVFPGLDGRAAGVRDGADGLSTRKERIARITGEVFASSGIRENLRVLCDEIGGRVSGTEAGRQARFFSERTFKRYGLSNVHQETFPIHGWQNVSLSCRALSPTPFTLHPVPLANTPSTPDGGVEAAVIDVGHGNPAELEKLGDEVKGKFALAVAGVMPGGRWMHRSEVMAEAAAAGAAGLLYQTTRDGHLPMTGMCWTKGISPVPGIGIAREDGGWIRRQLERGREVVLNISMTNLDGPVESANVIGEIPGRGRDVVIVGAHLDSWDLGQGAVDNGTGSAVVIEAARALAALGVEPEATIRFILFMGEEMGLYGSNAYVKEHDAQMKDCRAMINCDMEGTPLGVRLMWHEESAPWFEELISAMEGFDLTRGVIHRHGIYGDQQAFLLAGVPVVMPVSRVENDGAAYYHTWADTFDKVDFRSLNLDAVFVACLALELASTPERVMRHLEREDIEELVEKHELESLLPLWGNWPPDAR